MSQHLRHPQLLALGAITLWSSLATLGVALAHVPPLLSTAMLIVVSGRAMTWPRQTSQLWVNQPGDALCYVSPARFAFSSLTSAKRITRLILRAVWVGEQGESQKLHE